MSLKHWISASFVVVVLLAGNAMAQAPAGSTGLCKDGTYSNAPKKAGACSGHKGVKTWYAETSSTAAPAAAAKATPAPAPVAAKPSTAPAPVAAAAPVSHPAPAPSTAAPAAGGGPGMVWVNTASKVYHCPGTKFYGKTKAGKYLSESAAKAEGDKADHGQTCSK